MNALVNVSRSGAAVGLDSLVDGELQDGFGFGGGGSAVAGVVGPAHPGAQFELNPDFPELDPSTIENSDWKTNQARPYRFKEAILLKASRCDLRFET